MPQLTASQIIDITVAGLRELGRLRFQQIAQNLQEYEVLGKWLKADKLTFDTGYGIQRQLQNKLSNQARHVGLFDEDSVDLPDLLKQLRVDWVHADTKWVFEYRSDVLMNSGRSLVLNVLKPRRADALISLAEELEQKAWVVPASDNTTDPYGLPYWVVTNAQTGFNGGLPSGHTRIGNISLDETPNFKNYTAQYTTVSKPDLVKKLRTACRKTKWKSPVGVQDYTRDVGQRHRLYVNEATLSDFEDIGEAQNENLGVDLAPMGGARDVGYVSQQLVFRKHPIIWVPQLDDSSVFTAATDPVYMIDHGTFYPIVLQGNYLRESEPEKVPNRHNVFRAFVDLSYNYVCVDRRRNAVLSKA